MDSFFSGAQKPVAVFMGCGLFLAACSADVAPRRNEKQVEPLQLGPEISLGTAEANPATPFLRFAPDGRLFAVWTEDAAGQEPKANSSTMHHHESGKMAPSPLRDLLLAAARFPIIEFSPDGNLLVAWIDRRIDNPKPHQLYLMRIATDGRALTKNYPVGAGLCECCKLGIAFADGGKTVYLVDRQVDEKQIRNHVLRKSTDGGVTFGTPVEISDDGWQVPSCPHSGPSIGIDSRGRLHVSWFTLGRSEKEAGIYYSVSQDGGKSFAPRRLVHANTAPEVLYNNLAVGADDTVYLAWSNLDKNNRAQIFMRTISADGSWSPIQQLSQAKGDASRPVLALGKNQLHIAWTETDGEASRAVMRTARINP